MPVDNSYDIQQIVNVTALDEVIPPRIFARPAMAQSAHATRTSTCRRQHDAFADDWRANAGANAEAADG